MKQEIFPLGDHMKLKKGFFPTNYATYLNSWECPKTMKQSFFSLQEINNISGYKYRTSLKAEAYHRRL